MQDLSGFSVLKGFRGGNAIKVRLWWAIRATMFVWSPQVLHRWQAFLLYLFNTKIERNVVIRLSVKIAYLWELTLGDCAWVGDDVNLHILDRITIGAHSVISQRGYLCTGSHDHVSQHFTINATPIAIGEKCQLATDVFAAPGIMIGDGTVVGARSSVFRLLPANMVCRGNLAVVIHERVETG